jgi:1,4-alpha-glucan branching enzyme
MPDATSTHSTLITADDLYLFNEGSHNRLYQKLGAHIEPEGTRFAVWAPNAAAISVIGDFNGWERGRHPLAPVGASGIWEATVPDAGRGALYKYHIVSSHRGYTVDKADPVGIYHEIPPNTASIVWDLAYDWQDAAYRETARERNGFDAPMSIYEVHLGSWMRHAERGNVSLSYKELAEQLPPYVERMGFTHVEFLPVMEHPFFGSCGYQSTG